jgi:hypothetical protein
VIHWFNYIATLKILIFGLLLGAALAALFAVGVRLNAEGAGVAVHSGAVAHRNPILLALSRVIFAFGAGRGDRRRAVHSPGLHRPSHRLVHPGREAQLASHATSSWVVRPGTFVRELKL